MQFAYVIRQHSSEFVNTCQYLNFLEYRHNATTQLDCIERF